MTSLQLFLELQLGNNDQPSFLLVIRTHQLIVPDEKKILAWSSEGMRGNPEVTIVNYPWASPHLPEWLCQGSGLHLQENQPYSDLPKSFEHLTSDTVTRIPQGRAALGNNFSSTELGHRKRSSTARETRRAVMRVIPTRQGPGGAEDDSWKQWQLQRRLPWWTVWRPR